MGGKPMKHIPWGRYEDDMPYIQELLDRAPSEFKGLKGNLLRTLTSKATMQQWYERSKKGTSKDYAKMQGFDFEQERADFGKWVADYLDDAGYDSWVKFSFIYKTMIMTAFPPLEELDQASTKQETMQDFEKRLLRWLEVMDRYGGQHK